MKTWHFVSFQQTVAKSNFDSLRVVKGETGCQSLDVPLLKEEIQNMGQMVLPGHGG